MSLFFLTKLQEKVFRVLDDEARSVTDIALLCHLPRTSVAKALVSMEDLGLVHGRKVRQKNRHLYERATDVELQQKIQELSDLIFEKHAKNGNSASPIVGGPFVFYRGVEAVFSALTDMVSLRKNERVYVVQGKDAPKEWIKFLGEERIVFLHQEVVKHELILVSLRSESMKQELSKNGKIKKSYEGRLATPHVMPDEYFEEKTTLYLFRGTTLFINLKEGYALKMQDKEMSLTLIKLIQFLSRGVKRDVLI